MLLLIRKELILRQFRRQTDDTEIGIITVGRKGRFGMRTSEHTRIEFHTNQHIKRLVLKSQQHRHLHRDIRVVIFAALDLIDITERIPLQVTLTIQRNHFVTSLRERRHTPPRTYAKVKEKTGRTVFFTRLHLIHKPNTADGTETGTVLTLRRHQRPVRYLRRSTDIIAYFRLRRPANEQRK